MPPRKKTKYIISSYKDAVASALSDYARHMADLANKLAADLQLTGESEVNLPDLMARLNEVEEQLCTLEDQACSLATEADEGCTSAQAAIDAVGSLTEAVRDVENNSADALTACNDVRDAAREVSNDAQGMGGEVNALIQRVQKAIFAKESEAADVRS